MIKFIPALCAVAAAVSQDYHDSYDAAWYDNYVDEFAEEHGHDPHTYENPVDDHHFHDEHYDEYPQDSHYGDVPTGDFWHQVDEFNEWNTIWDQDHYEDRLHTEAELMVALEALREDLVELDHDIDDLDSCISHNDSDIEENDAGISHNDEGIHSNDDEISDQDHRVSRCQRACRRHQEELDQDRDFLVLHCQQFAFAADMVGACADILTCRDTNLSYRADVFNGNPNNRQTQHHEYNAPDYHHDEDDHDHHYVPQASPYEALTPGHYDHADGYYH